MPCCGGKNGGKPITRTQYVVGRVVFAGIRVALRVGLVTVGRVSPRFREIARFWELLSADWADAIARRDGIVLTGAAPPVEHDDACPLAPPSHALATGGDARFGRDWPQDDALLA